MHEQTKRRKNDIILCRWPKNGAHQTVRSQVRAIQFDNLGGFLFDGLVEKSGTHGRFGNDAVVTAAVAACVVVAVAF